MNSLLVLNLIRGSRRCAVNINETQAEIQILSRPCRKLSHGPSPGEIYLYNIEGGQKVKNINYGHCFALKNIQGSSFHLGPGVRGSPALLRQ